MADEAKAKGNAAFSSGNFPEAIRHFTDAINLSPSNHVLYSNRSAAYASLHRYAEALEDASKTVELKPDWPKGYGRLGAAHLGAGDFAEAISAYEKGLAVDPTNEALKSGLADARSALRSDSSAGSSFGKIFQGPELWAKLTADPTTRAYLQQPDFVRMLQDIQKNPNNMSMYLSDQRMMNALGVLLNVKMGRGGPGGGGEMERDFPMEAETPVTAAKETAPEPMEEVPDEESEEKERKKEAQKEKELGNAAYKKKDFDEAISHYSKALELDDEDISFLTNRAAVYLEMGKSTHLPSQLPT